MARETDLLTARADALFTSDVSARCCHSEAEIAAAVPAHFRVTLIVPSLRLREKPVHPTGHLQSEFEAHLIWGQPRTQRPGCLLRRLRDPIQPLGQPAALVYDRLLSARRHQITLGRLEHHFRTVIEGEPQEFGHHTPSYHSLPPTLSCIFHDLGPSTTQR
jgi:hypothetical protein